MIDIASLPSLNLQDRRSLPDCSAIYFALSDAGEILYIGKTVNLAQRWLAHHRYAQLESMGPVKLAWLECDSELLEDLESELIYVLSPVLNGAAVPRTAITTALNTPRLIRWRLNVVMADRRICAKDLAKKMGMSHKSVLNLRSTDNYPRISSDTLEKLCFHLQCTPSDLIEYTPDTSGKS